MNAASRVGPRVLGLLSVFVVPLGTASLLLSGCTGDIDGTSEGSVGGVGAPGATAPGNVPRGGTPTPGGSTVGSGTPSGSAPPAVPTTPLSWDLNTGFRCDKNSRTTLAAFRQLTSVEYRNTIRDLLGFDTNAGDTITFNEESAFFRANASPIQQLEVENYANTATGLADRAVKERLADLLPCAPVSPSDAACARQFITQFGMRAFRRPLDKEEVDQYFTSLFTPAATEGGFNEGVRTVVEFMLQSPNFIYHIPVGKAGTTVTSLSDYEVASQLSYFLWQTMPDEALMATAAAGKLANGTDLKAQVDRLLAHENMKRTIQDFLIQWINLEEALTDDKVQERLGSLQAFIDDNWTNRNASFVDLMTSSEAFVNQQMAPLFGVKVTGEAYQKVNITDGQRHGFLTQPAVMSAYGGELTWPIFRGLMIRERLLCQAIIQPPANAIEKIGVEPDPAKTTAREYLARLRVDAECSVCHNNFDPIGYSFAYFDLNGAYRQTEAGKPVDSKGELFNTADADGNYDSAKGLVAALAKSEEVRSCAARSIFRFGARRFENSADGCLLERMRVAFKDSSVSLREMIRTMAMSEEFRSYMR